jgi:hypothetical protein
MISRMWEVGSGEWGVGGRKPMEIARDLRRHTSHLPPLAFFRLASRP